jgi:hypothetical protein
MMSARVCDDAGALTPYTPTFPVIYPNMSYRPWVNDTSEMR